MVTARTPRLTEEKQAVPVASLSRRQRRRASWPPTERGPHEKSYSCSDQAHSFVVVRNAHAQLRPTMFGTCHAWRKRRGIRPAGTISREVLRYSYHHGIVSPVPCFLSDSSTRTKWRCIPEMNEHTSTSRSEMSTVGRPGHREDRTCYAHDRR